MSREYYSNVELEYEISKKIQGSYLWMGIGLLITFGIMFLGLYNTDLAAFSIEISSFFCNNDSFSIWYGIWN